MFAITRWTSKLRFKKILKRFNRLLSVLIGTSEPYGIGIDEEMAVAIVNEVDCEVIGSSGTVLFLEKQTDNEGQFMINILKNNSKFKLERNFKNT